VGLASVNDETTTPHSGIRPRPTLAPEVLVPRLGDYLVEKGLLTAEDLQRALDYQTQQREDGPTLLGQVLVDLGCITREALDQAITEQILQLRNALQTANRQLERRVQERTAELEAALQKLEAVNKLKSNIVANISHELRTPLTHIAGYLELMVTGDLGPLNEEQVRTVRVLIRSAERLERLIEDLILFSVTERGDVSLRLQPARLQDIFVTLIERIRQVASERKVNFDFVCPPVVPIVELDAEKISWTVYQLLDNAVKFTPPNGDVTLQVENIDSFVQVSIQDTGIGIPAERFAEIFEPFYQLDGSSTRKYGGTGLGLALVKKIIEAHGSKIEVISTPGEGSIFRFRLKASPRAT
jgi:signal transduction histidine kinase